MSLDLIFRKTGKEIKESIKKRIASLESRLISRNNELDNFLDNRKKVRSYILRNSKVSYGHGGRFSSGGTLFGKEHISSEQVEEINQLCKRVMEIEQEIIELKLIIKHLQDNQEFELNFQDLIDYGFDIEE